MPAVAASTDKIQLIYDLGIVQEPDERGLIPKGFTRADFARSLYVMSKTDYAAVISVDNVEAYASDIASNKYCKEIMAVLALGHMKTDAEGNFNPSDAITKKDLIYAIVSVLGYMPMAEASGSTDAAFLSIATKTDLFRGVSIENPEKLTALEVAQTFANAMGIPFLKYEYLDWGDTCLWDRWGLMEGTGRILANSTIGLAVEKTDAKWVNIGGELYYSRVLVQDELVGSEVKFYTVSGDHGDEVVSIYVKSYSKNITLQSDDIKSVADKGGYLEVKSQENDIIKIDKLGYLLMNGKTQTPTVELFDLFQSGTVTFINTDNDNDYDVIHMTCLFQTVIDGVNASTMTLATRYDNQIIKLEKVDVVDVYLNKKAATLSDLKSGMAVGIACDAFSVVDGELVYDFANAEYIRIYASNRVETGYVESMKGDETFLINDLTRTFGSGYRRLVEGGHIPEIKLGSYINAHYDNLGQLTYYELADGAESLRYGYLVAAAAGSDVLATSTEIKVMGTDGKFNIYKTGKKFVLDGERVDAGSTLYTVNDADDVDLTKRQVIRYRVIDGVLKEIDTTVMREDVETEIMSLDMALTFDPYVSGGTKSTIRSGAIDRKWAFASSCVAFVDEAPLDDPNPDEALFSTSKPSGWGNVERYIGGYDLNENSELAVLVYYPEYGATGAVSTKGLSYHLKKCYIVEDVSTTKDKNENEGWTVKLAGEGTQKTHFVPSNKLKLYSIDNTSLETAKAAYSGEGVTITKIDNSNFTSTIKPGDIIRYSTNAADEITYIEKVFDFDLHKDAIQQVPTQSGQIYGYALLDKISGSNFIYKYTTADTAQKYISRKSDYYSVVPVYHVETGEVEMVSFANVPSAATGNTVKAYLRYYNYGVVHDHIFYLYD